MNMKRACVYIFAFYAVIAPHVFYAALFTNATNHAVWVAVNNSGDFPDQVQELRI